MGVEHQGGLRVEFTGLRFWRRSSMVGNHLEGGRAGKGQHRRLEGVAQNPSELEGVGAGEFQRAVGDC